MPFHLPSHPYARIALVIAAAAVVLWPLALFSSYNSHSPPGSSYYPADHPLTLSALAARNLAAARDAISLLDTSAWADFAPRSSSSQPGDDDDDDDDEEGGGSGGGGDGSYGPGRYANLTGFREEDGYAWQDLGRFRARCAESRDAAIMGAQQWGDDEGEAPVWRNVSGIVHGGWIRTGGSSKKSWEGYNLSTVAPWLDWSLASAEWGRNVTGSEGVMTVILQNKESVLDWGNGRRTTPPGHDRNGKPEKSWPPISYPARLVRGVRADVTVEDVDGDSGTWDMRLHGVHFPREGTLLLTTSSEKFDGIFGLPFFTPGQDHFMASRELLGHALSDKIDSREQDAFADGAIPWTSDLEHPSGTTTPQPHCEFVLFAQVHPPKLKRLGRWGHNPVHTVDAISEMEAELEKPIGVRIGPVSPLQMSTVLWSPDCAFFLESKGPPVFSQHEGRHLVGVKKEEQRRRINMWVLCYAAIMYAQVRLLQLQIRESCTPSTMGRISFTTMSLMVSVDGTVFTVSSTWSLSAGFTLLPCLTLVFASFVSSAIGGGFLAKIYEIQLPSNRPAQRDAPAPTTTTPNAAPAPAPPLPGPATETNPLLPDLPLPATARRPLDTPVIITPSDQDIDAEMEAAANNASTNAANNSPQARPFQAMVRIFILSGISLTFVALASTSWHPSIRAAYLNACAFAYCSLWLPQICRNAARNSRRSLAWRFVIGQTVLRLAPLAYFWLNADNFMFARTDWAAFVVMVAWVWIQLCGLAVQDILGPRFALPESWTPPAWDYHRLLREDALEAGGLPVGLPGGLGSEPSSPVLSRDSTTGSGVDNPDRFGASRRRRKEDADSSKVRIRGIDCAICTERVEVAIIKAGEEDDSGVAGVLARRAYMLTPCRHIFHSGCLEGWMRYKLQCPICREDLPPL